MSIEGSALQQCLVAAARDPEQRGRAMGMLRGATVWAPTWPGDPSALRTLTSSSGVTALVVFTTESLLQETAQRYGWLDFDGTVSQRALHVSEAVRFARHARADLLVIDTASEHAFELDHGEMELLSAPPSSRPAPEGGAPRVRSTAPPPPGEVQVARVNDRGESERPSEPGSAPRAYSAHKPSAVRPDPEHHVVSATFGATATATMAALERSPDDALIEALSQVLRGYPEVEWASLVEAARSDRAAQPSVALRVQPSFRQNLGEISRKLREASAKRGLAYDVLMLDTQEQIRAARQLGTPFYPWRKKAP